MSDLKKVLDEKYPMPTGDVLDELKQDRLRMAFTSGVYWALSKFMAFIPEEDKNSPFGYNAACEDIINNMESFQSSIK